jgi:hypothetical protein
VSKQTVGRLVAGSILGLLYALYMFSLQAGYVTMGKDRYLAYQSSHWDLLASRSVLVSPISTFVFLAGFFCVYELFALGVSRLLLKPAASQSETTTEETW